MKDLMTKRPMLALLIVSVTAAVVSAWLLNPNIGPAALLGSATAGAFVLKLTTIVLIIAMGASLTYIVMRVAIGPEAFGLVEAGPAYTPGRRIAVQGRGVAQRQRTANEALDELESMIGLGSVKNEVNKLLASLEIEKKRREQGLPVAPTSRHMVFTGPPGVGKTVVAGVLGDIYRSLGVLRKGHFVPVERSDLVAGYVGQTASKTLEKCKEALDGILFIDEAYSLVQQSGASWDFGREAIDTLLKFMEDNRDRIVIIVAGYPNHMRQFIAANPGLEGRFTRTIDFPAYEPDELIAILKSMARLGGYVLPDDLETKLRPWLESSAKRENWANAREMRTLLEHARDAQAVRISADSTADLDPDDLKRLEMTDFESVIGPVQSNVEVLEKRRLTVESRVEQARGLDQALGDLEAMIGLGSVKAEVNKLLASLEVEKKRREQGLPVAPTSRHMVFTGPPGVGKTVVAGVLGDIYRSLGVLRKGHFVPVDRSDLVAGYVGQTATKTLEICKSALDGILFIDEAYSLVQQSGASWDFGREAIDTLLKFMEDNRERIIVIAAGYPNDMRRFVAANQGLQSRFTKTIDFPAFSTDELLTILRSMAGKAGYQLPDDSLVQVRSWIESRRKDEAWGNARSVRTLLEAAREAQAVRISGDPSADLVRIEPDDIEAAIAAQA